MDQMVKVQATRGVVIGVGRSLKPGEVGEVSESDARFLKSIKAVTDPEPAKQAK